jgi:ABC-type oligopeptide transport system ATPase subunit
MSEQETIKSLTSKAERIGVIGSPSSTSELTLDILGTAVAKKLVGELCMFHYPQDGSDHYALGQITEVELRNIWMEDATMRSIVRQKGQIDPISERQDTHIGKLNLSAVFADKGKSFEPSILGTIPSTGTSIQLVNDLILDNLLHQYRNQIFYLGHVYGSTPKLPMWFKHFDRGADGAGEAYHIGIFGKSGSGKSVLAKMMLVAYARNRQMGIFILDPQGEFTKGLKANTLFQDTEMDYILSSSILNTLQRRYSIYNLYKIALNRWELFTHFLIEFNFFFDLGIKFSDYQNVAGDYVQDYLKDNSKITFASLSRDTLLMVLDYLDKNIHRIYSGAAGIERVREFIQEFTNKVERNEPNRLLDTWNKVCDLFNPGKDKKSPKDIISEALRQEERIPRPLVIIDLSAKPPEISQYIWDERIKPLIIDCFLDELIRTAEFAYKGDQSLNTLVVMDEAHRLAPRGKAENPRKDKVRATLIDAVRTTRKYGLGWMFISQTLSSLDRAIIEQLRIYFFGFGLSMGTEFQALGEIAGGDKKSLKLYQMFRDPHSSFDAESREYPFMTVGPVSPLSFSGTPLFFNAFNKPEEFLDDNEFIKKNR